jgi:hypothetical protein
MLQISSNWLTSSGVNSDRKLHRVGSRKAPLLLAFVTPMVSNGLVIRHVSRSQWSRWDC